MPDRMTALGAADFVKRLSHLSGTPRNSKAHFALAVSGGGDSLALMVLAGAAAKKDTPWRFSVLTVNHGLRPEAGAETAYVARLAKETGLACRILEHKGPRPRKDIQAAARGIRYDLMSAWCGKNRVGHLVLAHHLEDQAETFLLRLARGSGLDGLAAMKPSVKRGQITLLRPYLDVSRRRLRKTVARAGWQPVADPGNTDRRFARVRIRGKMAALAEEGLTAERLAQTAERLSRARQTLDHFTDRAIEEAVSLDAFGVAHLDRRFLATQPKEILRRAVSRVLTPFRGYPPRAESVNRVLAEGFLHPRPPAAGGKTVNGFVVRFRRDSVLVFREMRNLPPVMSLQSGQSPAWDNGVRVHVAPRARPARGLELGPLTAEGVKILRDNRVVLPKNLPAAALSALPSIWLAKRQKRQILAVQGILPHDWIRFEPQMWF